ncbi:hypothetical protein [Catellatospora chokoriensis]|uniref:Uncharacterized protein n=1 Tax=Catellatospora chokoriensis TaxID=310353 RepID=A0A8J3NR45_9ACTN|nr:hypothetical protein [Catellatospora chokoriensis]GIF89832.1 hypothetical protein Cch02nite_32760 [Catellatospora chokoriensis]
MWKSRKNRQGLLTGYGSRRDPRRTPQSASKVEPRRAVATPIRADDPNWPDPVTWLLRQLR